MNKNELYHKDHKYIKREWVKGKWRYWYDDKGTVTKSKKYNEYDLNDHTMYTTTKQTISTDSLFTPMNKTERYTDSAGENHKVITDYEGKVERTVEAGADFIARVIQKKAADIAFKRAANNMLREYIKKASN